MADQATIPLCILWEGELRDAARLLRVAAESQNSTDHQAAYMACHVALFGLSPERAVVMLANDEIRKRAKKKTVAQ